VRQIVEMIQLIDLTKQYREIKAVDRINLHVDKGARFGFLGPNGAGKTTTIKMMTGVLQPTGGRIIINGYDMAVSPAALKACIGFIPDRPFMYEKLTGLEFLDFVAGLYGLDRSARLKGRMADLLTRFDLQGWEDQLIESYSHGMKQRLVMCAALVHEPEVLIVDEPMVGLDPKGARLVKDIFKEQAGNGVTLFMSTHSLETAEEVCEKIAIIRNGRLVAHGTPEELRNQAGTDGKLEDVFLRLTQEKGIAKP